MYVLKSREYLKIESRHLGNSYQHMEFPVLHAIFESNFETNSVVAKWAKTMSSLTFVIMTLFQESNQLRIIVTFEVIYINVSR